MQLKHPISSVLIAGAGLLLTACGGGGGADTGFGDVNGTGATSSKVLVRGPITGFGSIIVNGRRFESDEAVVDFRDQMLDVNALRVGQIVSIEGSRDTDGNLSAGRISYDADIVGPITAIDLDARTITVAGQTILVVSRTVFDDVDFEMLAVGDFVEISAGRDGDGVFTASYVEREEAGDVEVVGVIRDLDTDMRTFRLGQLIVDYAGVSGEDLDDIVADAVVEVEGRLEGETLFADEVEREDDDSNFVEAGVEVEITGTVSERLDADRFRLRGFTVTFDGSTEFEDGGPDNILEGVRLEVEGRIGENGILRAEEIEFEDDDDRFAAVEIEARVQAVGDNRIDVFGISVRTDARTRISNDDDDSGSAFGLENIVVGDFVEIAALADDDVPALLATRIARDEDDDDDDELTGFVDSFDAAAGTLVVSGVMVDANNSSFENDGTADVFFERLTAGDRIEVEGRFDGTVLQAEDIERQDNDVDDGADDDTDDDTDV